MARRVPAWVAAAILLLIVASIPAVASQQGCPPPSGCWTLIDGVGFETDVGGVKAHGGVFKSDGSRDSDLQAAAGWPALAASAQSGGPTFDIGDQGGIVMRFTPGSSDSGGRSFVEMRVEFEQVQGLVWMNGTTMDFTYNLTAGQDHYEAVYFVVTQRMEDPITIPLRVTANPGQGDESSEGAQVQVETEDPPRIGGFDWLSFVLGLVLGVVIAWFLLARKKSGTGGSGGP